MAIDVYIWLSYRLHCLQQPTPITWMALHGQFGAGFKNLAQFKPHFAQAVNMALMVYPDARVDIQKMGLVLHPSRPPVADTKVHALCGRR